jgi:hypothetical protein
LVCERSTDQVPLLEMKYRDAEVWICPQHLPILIHKPADLETKLPGAASFGPSAGH